MRILKAIILFVVLVPALSHAQPNTTQGGAAGAQQMQNGSQPSSGECVGPHSFCNLFAGS